MDPFSEGYFDPWWTETSSFYDDLFIVETMQIVCWAIRKEDGSNVSKLCDLMKFFHKKVLFKFLK